MSGPPPGVTIPSSAPAAPLSPFEQAAKLLVESDAGLNIGTFILGFAFDAALCGLLINQVIHWSQWLKNESGASRIIVIWVTICSLLGTSLGVAFLFHLFAWNYGSFAQFLPVDWFTWYTLTGVAVTAPVQVFFTERAYRLNKNPIWIPLLVGILICGSVLGSINTKILEPSKEVYLQVGWQKVKPYIYLSTSSNFAMNLLITSSIMYGLLRSKSYWSATATLSSKASLILNETLLPPTILSFVILVSYGAKPSSHLLCFWTIWYPKAYAIALMSLLNSRFLLRQATRSELASGMENTFGDRSNRFGQGTVQIQTDIYVSETKLDPYFASPPGKKSVNRDPDLEESTSASGSALGSAGGYHGGKYGESREELTGKNDTMV